MEDHIVVDVEIKKTIEETPGGGDGMKQRAKRPVTKRWWALLCALTLTVMAHGQTALSGTVIDQQGTTWQNAAWTLSFTPTAACPGIPNGSSGVFSGQLSSEGVYNVVVPQLCGTPASFTMIITPFTTTATNGGLARTFGNYVSPLFTVSGSAETQNFTPPPPMFPYQLNTYGYTTTELTANPTLAGSQFYIPFPAPGYFLTWTGSEWINLNVGAGGCGSSPCPIAQGGTGATTAAGAQANLLNPTDQWVAVGADPVATINTACTYIAANNRSVRLNFPGSTFTFGSTASIPNTCSGLIINGTAGMLSPDCANPDTCMSVQGGTVFDCGGSQCLYYPGNGTTGPNNNGVYNIVFENQGATGFLQCGSAGTVGCGFPTFENIYDVGSTTVNASSLGMVLYNTQHATINNLKIANVNTGLSFLSSGAGDSIPGNSEISGLYVYTYGKSVANGNCSLPAIDNEANLNLYLRPQVNVYAGDSPGCSDGIYDNTGGTTYVDADLEGLFLNDFDFVGSSNITATLNECFGTIGSVNTFNLDSVGQYSPMNITSACPYSTIHITGTTSLIRSWFNGSFATNFPWDFIYATGGSGMTVGSYPITFTGGGCTTSPTATLYVHSSTVYDEPVLTSPGVGCGVGGSAPTASAATGGTPPTITVSFSPQAYGIFNASPNFAPGNFVTQGTISALANGVDVFGNYTPGSPGGGPAAVVKIEGPVTPSGSPHDPTLLLCPNGSDSYCGSIIQDYFGNDGNIFGMNFWLGKTSAGQSRDNGVFHNAAGNIVAAFYDSSELTAIGSVSFDTTHDLLMGSGEGIGFWNGSYTALFTAPSYSSDIDWTLPNGSGGVTISKVYAGTSTPSDTCSASSYPFAIEVNATPTAYQCTNATGSYAWNTLAGIPVIPGIKSTTGDRYVCVDTSGNLVSSATACSGT